MSTKMSTPEFITKAKKVHGDRYDYTKASYTNAHAEVVLVCREHGEFTQKAYSHLNGRGCPECGRISSDKSRKNDPRDVLNKLIEKFGDYYDFTAVLKADGCKDPFAVICPEHGVTELTSNRLLHPDSKYACPKCGKRAGNKNKNLKTTDWFVSKAKEVHGDRYDYSKAEYNGTFTEVTIICKEHGEFSQAPRVHLSGSGCTQCFKDKKSMENRMSLEEFIARSRSLYGDKFSYARSVYKGTNKEITITCNKHGDFITTPIYHFKNSGANPGGCPGCLKELPNATIIRKEEFEKRAFSLYAGKYAYKGYTKISAPVTILCEKHGEVEQIAYVHLRGGGCPICAKSANISKEEIQVYEFLSELAKVENGDRKLIAPKELDMVLPDHKLAVEFCGAYWHSDRKVPNDYHESKLKAVTGIGYNLLTMYSQEWARNRKLVKRLLERKLGLVKHRDTSNISVDYGAYPDVIDFVKRNNIFGNTHGNYVAIREGVSGKVLSAAIYEVNPDHLLVTRLCCDVRLENDELYLALLSSLSDRHALPTRVEIDLRWFTGHSLLQQGLKVFGTEPPRFRYTRGFMILPEGSGVPVEAIGKDKEWNKIFDCGRLILTN